MRTDDESEYREGIVLDRPTKQGQGSLVNCGMRKVRIYCSILPNIETIGKNIRFHNDIYVTKTRLYKLCHYFLVCKMQHTHQK